MAEMVRPEGLVLYLVLYVDIQERMLKVLWKTNSLNALEGRASAGTILPFLKKRRGVFGFY